MFLNILFIDKHEKFGLIMALQLLSGVLMLAGGWGSVITGVIMALKHYGVL
jgi:hypothetical protein